MTTKTTCRACGTALEPDAKFCPDCGASISEEALSQQPPPAAPAPEAAPEAKRKAAKEPKEQMGVFGYVLTLLALSIPIVGAIFTFVWAFGANTNRARRSFCRAVLIVSAIFLVLAGVCFALNSRAVVEMIDVLRA